MTHLISRPSGYYLRYVIPKRFKILIPSGEFRISLRTRLLSEAKIKSRLAFSAIEHTLRKIIKMQNVTINTDQVRVLVKNHVRNTLAYIEETHLLPDDSRTIADVDDEISSNDALIRELNNSLRLGNPKLVGYSASKLALDANIVVSGAMYKHFNKELTMAHIKLIKHHNKLLSGDCGLDDDLISGLGVDRGGVVISEAWSRYVEHRNSNRDSQLRKDAMDNQAAIISLFIEIVGDKDVSLISLADIEVYLSVMQKLPKRRKTSKSYQHKSIKELLALDLHESGCVGWKRRSDSFNVVRRFLDWCANERRAYIPLNPANNDELKVAKGKVLSYAPFEVDDLMKIFTHQDYVGGRFKYSWQFWVPLIAAYSGARQTEISQLFISDIILVDDIWVFNINDDGKGKKIKNSNARRLIPIHSVLIGLGVLEYAHALRANGVDRLFPELSLGVKGWGHEVSKWFNGDNKNRKGFKKQIELSDIDPLMSNLNGNKVFHSFRKSAITSSMGNSVTPHPKHFQVFGHEKGLLLGQSNPYVRLTTKELQSAIESIDYGLSHDALKGQWRRFVSQH